MRPRAATAAGARTASPTAARGAAGPAATTAALALAAVVAAVAAVGSIRLRVHREERRALQWRPPDDPIRGTAIVVLGSEAFPSGPGTDLRCRLEHAIRLWRSGTGSPILVSGGIDARVDEVDVMARYLLDRGIPENAVRPARPGQNTRDSVTAMSAARDDGVAQRFVVVSTAFHAHRILAECRRRGIPAEVAAPPDSPEMMRSSLYRARIATEIVGSVGYALPPAVMSRLRESLGRLRHTLPRAVGGQLTFRQAWEMSR